MTKLLISTALAGILAFAGAAYAQDRGDDHRGKPAAPAAHPAPAPAAHAAPPAGGRGARGFTPPPAPVAQKAPGPDRRGQEDHRPSAGVQNAPAAQPAPRNAMRAQGPNNATRGPDNRSAGNRAPAPNNNAMRGPGPNNNTAMRAQNNFSSFHRNFNAPRRYHAPVYNRPRGWYSHRWTFGEILPALFWAPNYWLDDYTDYGLEPPPPGTLWVRDGGDALLIVRATGEIIQVEYSVFY
jgi:Ni/Co efflux regulator RcnB